MILYDKCMALSTQQQWEIKDIKKLYLIFSLFFPFYLFFIKICKLFLIN